jgi:2,4-dienoyl-CoA reductase-like NADH-dependent reductase (Old Yellow Enzyme family)/thioredoxin reductase
MNFDKLFEPIKINSLELKNRLIVPAMGTNLANSDGTVSDRLKAFVLARAKGGFGLITTEAVGVSPHSKTLRYELELWDDRFVASFRDLAEAIHAHGAKIAVQLCHPGRQTSRSLSSELVAPSPIPCPFVIDTPKELSVEEIQEVEDQFAQAARRAKEAGIDAVEIHGAHGYLVAQFMSSYTNCRTDAYGVTLEGRLRFPIEIIRRVREEVGPKYPIIFKISGDERVPGGRDIQETKLLVKFLDQAGVDVFYVSTGVYGSFQYIVAPMSVPPGFNVCAAAQVKGVSSVPVIAAGRISDPYLAEAILEEELADLIAFGRSSIADADFPKKVASGNLDDIRWCVSCNQGCIGRVLKGQPISCMVNPEAGREEEMSLVPTSRSKKILVVGGGPGGMEAARVAALRGHDVHLYEKDNRLGGQVNLAVIPPSKQEFAKALSYLITQIKKAGVKVKLNTQVTEETIDDLKPDSVIVATGGRSIVPDIPGIHKEKVKAVSDILNGSARPGRNILIIGGGLIGCETADLLSQFRGRKVTIVELLHDIAMDCVEESRHFLMKRLQEQNVTIITGATVREIEDDVVTLERHASEEKLSGFDTIVLAAGSKAENGLFQNLEKTQKIKEMYIIGDAKEPRKAIDAIAEGAEIARKI